ncbi:MAG: cofactor-independent phosphoglycerate mutase [Nitrospinota bacterium]|nr:cofactor-independent phosphoglycerate mutase [Nitrospinota bacterium]
MKDSGKRIILLGDGMPDRPLEQLGGKTPLQAAKTPNMDRMAREGSAGFVHTVPEGFEPGSDVTNMGLLGYDPKKYYTGRAPLEAAGMHIPLGKNDVAYRCNLVTLSPTAEGVFMEDFSAGHISSGEAAQLIKALNDYFGKGDIEFHPGVSYRHLMIWKNGNEKAETTPPHDITGKSIRNYLPRGDAGERLNMITTEAQIILKPHSVNVKRKDDGKSEANSIWLWGQGKAPSMPKLKDFRGITGTMISAVDLMKGLGVLAGMDVINVEGATGFIDTNYEGKMRAAKEGLAKNDFVYIHIESPDESGHQGSIENKIRAIEDFDAKIVGPLLDEIARLNGRAIVLSDHPTPIELMTHTTDPVPFAIWPKLNGASASAPAFDESIITMNGSMKIANGYELFERFTEK